MYIPQKQLDNLSSLVLPGKVAVIYGARRVGKTTLINEYVNQITTKNELKESEILFVSGEDIVVKDQLASQSIQKLKEFVGEQKLLIIDEAQHIPQVGLNLKLIVDHIPDIKVIATGSSSFDLSKSVGEPLTGRKNTLRLLPLAQLEISQVEKSYETKTNLESRLIYGSYPEIVTLNSNVQREKYLRELAGAYLFKDILEMEGIRHSDKLLRLLQLLAFQIGKQVSHTELAGQLGMSKNTVERYLDLLEKVFIIFKIGGFSRNLRKEVTKNHRYFFYDNGIRNTIINNFNALNLRNDIGALWENYLVIERIKRQEYTQSFSNNYFWRSYQQNEIDWVEEREGKLFAFEMKWAPQKIKPPTEWEKSYPDSEFDVIHRDNYLSFITGSNN